jgi:alginate O-acetyltransferase complex protein AlgI
MDMVTAWLALLGYAMQIYFDFSGYSDMAIGLGRLFGIELPQNFNAPYRAKNPSDFWKRWHITLSQWLRDYLYISLGGNRKGSSRTQFNLLVTMIVGGLWHGASWNFAIWGLYHGLLLVGYHRFQAGWDRLSISVQRALCFVLITLGWIPFRANGLSQIRDWFLALFCFQNLSISSIMALPSIFVMGLLCAFLITQLVPVLSRERDFRAWGVVQQVVLGLAGAWSILCMNYSSRFLYFQF